VRDVDHRAKKPLVRALLIGAGLLSVGLGVLGIFLPLLPTTPFLLLAAACFIRSSSRLHHWLITHPWFGDYIYYYQRYRAISLRVKITSLALLWLTIGYSVIYAIQSWGVRALLVLIALGVTTHLLRLKTLTPAMVREVEPDARARTRQLCEPPGECHPAE
jgi:uncharacterized protein